MAIATQLLPLQPLRRYASALAVCLMLTGCASAPHPVLSLCNGTAGLQQGMTDPLVGAAGSGDNERVKALLAAGHDVNFQECDDLLQDGKVVAHRGWTPLMIAAGHGYLDVIRVLVQAGARLDVRESDGTTALSFAVESSQLAAADLLRSLGAKE
jgi:ankyrin repeat protein